MLPGKLKDCINGQGKDSEETKISGSIITLLQSCFEWVISHVEYNFSVWLN